MTEKELQAIYDAIMNKEVEKVTDLIDSIPMIKEGIIKYVSIYAKTKSEEEQLLYKKRYDFFLASQTNYFKIAITFINELLETGTVNVDRYSSFATIKSALIQFKNRLPEYQEYVDEILEIIKNRKIVENDYPKILDFYNIQRNRRATYEDEFYIVATSENPVSTFCKFNWSEKKFYTKLNSFKNKYPQGQDDGLADKFEMWFKQYLKLIKRDDKFKEIEQLNNEFQNAKSMVEDVISSGLSIYEYCHVNAGYRIAQIKKAFRRIYYYNDKNGRKSTKIIKEIEQREKPEFINELNFIKEEIICNDDFTVIDYYLSTKLHIDDFLDKVDTNALMNNFIWNNFQCVYNGMNTSRTPVIVYSTSRKREMKLATSHNGRVITNDEKELIFKFFEENEIPANSATYKAAVKKIGNNDLDFIQKINTYKGSI